MPIIRTTDEEVRVLASAVVELGNLAMNFGRIDRTCVTHPDGLPESDSDHTVMLTWIAPALAEMINLRSGYERYPVGKVAQYAVVHDACEVYAGDTPTHKITPEELQEKEMREADATDRLYDQFRRTLPWFARTVSHYENGRDPVARFVRSVDKIMPKIVHVINAARDLERAEMSLVDFRALHSRQRAQIQGWCPEPLLLQLYDALCDQVIEAYAALPAPSSTQPTGEHVMVVEGGVGELIHDCGDESACSLSYVFDKWYEWNTLPLNDGRYPVSLGDDGAIVFTGKD